MPGIGCIHSRPQRGYLETYSSPIHYCLEEKYRALFSQNHRIIMARKGHQVQLSTAKSITTMSFSATSTHLSNISRDGDSITSLDSLLQCLTTLSMKKFFLISSLNLPWSNLRPFPLDWLPSHYNLFSGTCRETLSPLWALGAFFQARKLSSLNCSS